MVFQPSEFRVSINLLAKEVLPTRLGAANMRLLSRIRDSAFLSSTSRQKKSSPTTGDPIFNFIAIIKCCLYFVGKFN